MSTTVPQNCFVFSLRRCLTCLSGRLVWRRPRRPLKVIRAGRMTLWIGPECRQQWGRRQPAQRHLSEPLIRHRRRQLLICDVTERCKHGKTDQPWTSSVQTDQWISLFVRCRPVTNVLTRHTEFYDRLLSVAVGFVVVKLQNLRRWSQSIIKQLKRQRPVYLWSQTASPVRSTGTAFGCPSLSDSAPLVWRSVSNRAEPQVISQTV